MNVFVVKVNVLYNFIFLVKREAVCGESASQGDLGGSTPQEADSAQEHVPRGESVEVSP